MPSSISSTAIDQKNLLANGESVFLVLAEITIPGVEVPIRVVRNTENITWRGYTWQAFAFEVDEINSTSKSTIPRVDLRVGNVNRTMGAYLEQYDLYVKENGAQPVEVAVYVVNTLDLANTSPVTEYRLNLKQPKVTSQWATFTLGALNAFMRRFPNGRVLRNACQYAKFKGTRCGYSGAATGCNRTLTRCRELGNSARFGGFPGSGFGGLNVA